jgi:hypothetical protein
MNGLAFVLQRCAATMRGDYLRRDSAGRELRYSCCLGAPPCRTRLSPELIPLD